MKGEVQVFAIHDGEERLVSKSSNLILDGMGELIADFMSMPSSITNDSAGGPEIDDGLYNKYINRKQLLEVSNYNIGAISFGKGSLGYTENSHKIDNVNLLGKSEDIQNNAAIGYSDGVWAALTSSVNVRTVTEEIAPDLSSTVTKVTVLSASLNPYDRRISQKCASHHEVSPELDSYIFSVDLKFNFDDFHSTATSGGIDSPYYKNRFSTIGIGQVLSSVEVSSTAAEYINEKFLVIRWDTSGRGHILTKEEDPTSDFNFGYLKELGDGWYRASVILDPRHNHENAFGLSSTYYVSGSQWKEAAGRNHTPSVAPSSAGSCVFSLKSNQFSFPEGHYWYGSDDQLSAVADSNIWLEKRVLADDSCAEYQFVRVPDSLWDRTDASTIDLTGPAAGWPTGGGGQLTCTNSSICGWDDAAGEQCEVMWRPTLSSEGDIPWEKVHSKTAGILGEYRLVSDSTVSARVENRDSQVFNIKNPKGYFDDYAQIVGIASSGLGHWDAGLIASATAFDINNGCSARQLDRLIFELFVERVGTAGEGKGHFSVSIGAGSNRYELDALTEVNIAGTSATINYYDQEDQNEGEVWHGYQDHMIDDNYFINGWHPKPNDDFTATVDRGVRLDEVKKWVTVHGDYFRIRLPITLPLTFTGTGKAIFMSFKPSKDGFETGDYRVMYNPRLYVERNTGLEVAKPTFDIHTSIYPSLPVQAYVLSGTPIGLSADCSSLKGSVYVSRPMLSYGRFPVDYDPTTTAVNREMPNFPLLASGVALANNLYGPSGQGSLYYDTSTPHPISNAPTMPKPTDTVLETGVVTDLETYCDIDLNLTQNPNFLEYNDDTDLEVFGHEVGDGIKDFGLRGCSRHLGAYAPRGGVVVHTLSSVDGSGYRSTLSSHSYSEGVNTGGSVSDPRDNMSRYGYLRAYLPLFAGGGTGDASRTAQGSLIVSADSDFSSTCQVSAISILPAGDIACAHFYGGIFEAGLHAIDFRKNLENQRFKGLRLHSKGGKGNYQIDSKPMLAASAFCLDASEGVIRFTTKTNPTNDKNIGIPTEDFSFLDDFMFSSNDVTNYNLKLEKRVINYFGASSWEPVPEYLWGYVDGSTIELSGNTELYGDYRWPVNDASTCFAPQGDWEKRLNHYGFDPERGIVDDIMFKPFAEASMANSGTCPIPFETRLPDGRGPLGPYRLAKVFNTEQDIDYKMIAKKTFTDNIAAARDVGTDAGVRHFGDVKIVWRLDFN